MEWRRVSSGTEHDLRRGRRLVRDRAARARVRARSGEGGRLVRRRVAAAGSAGQRQGWLTAFDADNGAVRWKFAASRPVLAGLTPTAGGVVFAADLGGTLYAFDAATGAVLWRLATGQSMGGGIVSYLAGGKQRIGVAAGMKSPIWPGGSSASQIVVYGLQ